MYQYAATDPRLERGRYFYAPFEGPSFLAAYRETRQAARARLAVMGPGRPVLRGAASVAALPEPGACEVDTARLIADGLDRADRATAAPWVAILIRKFEVGRVLWARYGADLRPVDRTEVSLDSYARFAALLAREAAVGPDLGALSTLLKVGDVLCHALAADPRTLTPDGAAAVLDALTAELALVDAVIARPRASRSVERKPEDAASTAPVPASGDRLAGVTLLAADTARARAYLSVLAADGLRPERAVVIELAGAATVAAASHPTPLFDNATPLMAALERAAVRTTRLEVDRFEDEAVLRALDRQAGDLVVVAPPAGVILAPAFFAATGRRYLHVHPGRLPAYRGSTPMYYELLAEGRLTATALFLDAGIDTGAVVAEREFAPPADLTTMDHAFDPWMRAALLRDVLADRRAGRQPTLRPQPAGAGRTFFVIHPVLRHVALLDSEPARITRARGGSLPRIGRGPSAARPRTMG